MKQKDKIQFSIGNSRCPVCKKPNYPVELIMEKTLKGTTYSLVNCGIGHSFLVKADKHSATVFSLHLNSLTDMKQTELEIKLHS